MNLTRSIANGELTKLVASSGLQLRWREAFGTLGQTQTYYCSASWVDDSSAWLQKWGESQFAIDLSICDTMIWYTSGHICSVRSHDVMSHCLCSTSCVGGIEHKRKAIAMWEHVKTEIHLHCLVDFIWNWKTPFQSQLYMPWCFWKHCRGAGN